MTGLIETPFKLSLEEILCSAAATVFLNALSNAGSYEIDLEQLCLTPQYGFTASASLIPCGPRFVRITDIKESRIDWNTVPYCECPDPENYQLYTNDILIARAGSIGKSFIIREISSEAVFASYMIRLRVKPGFHPEYIYWCLQSQQFWAQIMEAQRGSAMKNINAKMISSLRFPVPSLDIQFSVVEYLNSFQMHLQGSKNRLPSLPYPLEEQRRIVARIEELAAKIEEARGLREKTIEASNQLFISTINSILSSAEWEKIRIGDLLRENSQNGLSAFPSNDPPGIPILRISAATSRDDAIIDENDYRYIELDNPISAKYSLERGDILVCRFNGNLHNVGRFALYTNYSGLTHVYPDKLIRLRVDNSKILPQFICWAANSTIGRKSIEAFCATTAGNIGISAGNLKSILIPVPPLSEQKKIIDYFNHFQSYKFTIQQKQAEAAAELDALLPSILDKAFKGEL